MVEASKKAYSDYFVWLALFSSLLSISALHFSPALSSISLGVCCVSALANFVYLKAVKVNPRIAGFLMVSVLLLLWQICTSLWQYPGMDIGNKALLKLPLLMLPLLMPAFRFNQKQLFIWLLAFSLPLTWIGLASCAYYFNHFAFLNQMILESKPLPIFTQVYHIEFSVILAASALLGITYVLSQKDSKSNLWVWLLWSCVILNVVILHVLSTRTGLLSFWAGLFTLLVWHGRKRFNGRKLFIAAVLSVFILSLVVFSVPSLKHRFINTVDDVKSVAKGADLNQKSFGQRWLAWSTALQALKTAPMKGFGMEGVENAMSAAYESAHVELDPANRIMPHNQYLDLALQSGIIALFLLLVTLGAAARYAWKSVNPGLLSMVVLFGFSFLVESLLERQAGILVFVLAISVSFNFAFPTLPEQKTDKPKR